MFSRYKFGRASANRMYPDTCKVYRNGPAENEYGDPITGMVRQFEVRCNAQVVASRFLFQTPDFARLSNLRWSIEVPHDSPPIFDNDLLFVQSHEDPTYNGWFQVEGSNRATTDNVSTKIDVHTAPEPSNVIG